MTIPLLLKSDLTVNTFNSASSGDNSVVAAVTGSIIRVHRMHLTAAAAVVVQVKSGSTVVDTIQFNGAAPLPFVLEFSDRPYYTMTIATALQLNLSSAVSVTGTIETVTSVP